MNIKIILLLSVLCVLVISSCSKEKETTNDVSFAGWAVGSVENGSGAIFFSKNQGLSWENQKTSITENTELHGVFALSVMEAWIVGDTKDGYGMILYTKDGGVSWKRSGTVQEIPNAALRGVVVINDQTIWVVGDSSTILKTINGGLTWQVSELAGFPKTNFTCITASGNGIWAAGTADSLLTSSGVVAHTFNGGATWQQQGNPGMHPELTDIESVNDSLVFISGYEYVCVSRNGGSTWYPLLYLESSSISGICAADANNIWATSPQNAIYRSHNQGISWDTIRSGYANTTLFDVTSITDNHTWVCGQYGSGGLQSLILYSNNSGSSWFFGANQGTSRINKISFSTAVR